MSILLKNAFTKFKKSCQDNKKLVCLWTDKFFIINFDYIIVYIKVYWNYLYNNYVP
ncbi:Hypothetical protein MCYN_0701 [Mycoplasmopsis cynos C142]|uniref:Uncharacterized protein n=1 Tax=Mycoplasmopsis cynos (strain C142) TaxID=1246955 RepID=L0RUX5_MYCC1|nr:Hypothetical protein MCYN_0701 [Mycoplasmopsis cynos C142]